MKTHGPATTAALITGMLLLGGCGSTKELAAGGYEGGWTETGKVIESFPVDSAGVPTR